MRVFVAGGTGVIGRRLVPQLVARGHQVTATTTSAARLGLLEQLGAEGVVMDGLDASSVGEAVASARPDAIAHQMTAIGSEMDLVHMDRWFATTNRLRTEGTDHLLAAAEASGVSNFVAQSYAGWNGIREGGWVKTEDGSAGPAGRGRSRTRCMAAIDHVEDVVVRAGGAALRFGWLYGPGATDGLAEAVRQRHFPHRRGRRRPHLLGARRRRGERDGPGRRAAGEGRVQHRRRRAGAGERVAPLPGGVRGRESHRCGSPVAGHGRWPERWRCR